MLRPWPVIGSLLVAAAIEPSFNPATRPSVHLAIGPSGNLSIEQAANLRSEGLDLAYNLDHDAAIERLRRAVASAPADAAARRTLASVLWLNILFGRGSVTVDHYLGSFTRTQVALKAPPEHLATEFSRNVGEAIALARARVNAAPRDPQAHYDLGAALGLEASYIATVEGRLLAGFRAARRCYDEHEKVLELDPSRSDAGLAVGTYRYLVSSLPVHMRMLAYVAGFGGGKSAESSSSSGLPQDRGRREPTPCSLSYWCTTVNGDSMTRCECYASCGRPIRATGWSFSKRAQPPCAAAGPRKRSRS